MSHKVELLAPAGNYESFIGAINAGADAIYVGGEKFSARAFAENFDTETLCGCIKYAHLFGRRVYLTLNTLIKQNEFDDIYDYVKPFYEAGLDGVIIQDLGVLRCLKEHFPHMELHASTQMAVTGPEFVKMCKELGISRVVPARELSLQELKQISDAGIEVECFIHGAMCYCYSGMCLMSSILGGRSGNRGRCAQPCRLPYDVSVDSENKNATHTLSLKDMCTIEHLPKLIKAGMASFKIEGRMKRSEYAAGVTALYRKYIDAYYANPNTPIQIDKNDRYILEHLYIRSQLQDGYLAKHNGKEMVTFDAPNYNGVDDKILANISEKYLGYTQKIPVSMYAYFSVDEVCQLTLFTDDGISITVSGDVVSKANQVAATEDSILKQLTKFGNTHFTLKDSNIAIEGEAFLPNGMLNALRRDAVEQLEKAIITAKFPEITLRNAPNKEIELTSDCTNRVENHANFKEQGDKLSSAKAVSVLVSTPTQLDALLNHTFLQKVNTLYLEETALDYYLQKQMSLPGTVSIAYAMPYILRAKHLEEQRTYLRMLNQKGINNILVRNVEELSLAKALMEECDFKITTDASLYCWNIEAIEAMHEVAGTVTLPFELNTKELRPLRSSYTEQIVYAYIPLMITANCIFKSNATCKLGTGQTRHQAFLTDRYGKVFSVITNCKYCYNTIYNSVPLSLHKKYNQALPGSVRLQFSIEDATCVLRVLDYYLDWLEKKPGVFPIEEYTTAHENRQVE